MITRFVVVEAPSAYNVILGRPTLNQARAVVFTYSLVVKFPTPQGTRILRGDQATARSCYITSLCKNALAEALRVEEMDPRGDKEGVSPVEELVQVILDAQEPDRSFSIGSLLEPGQQEDLTLFLRRNQDVFAWNHQDIPEIDPQVISHPLNIDPTSRSVKQKRRGMASERQEAVRDEIIKLLKAESIREVQYPDWLANIPGKEKQQQVAHVCGLHGPE